MHFFFKTEEIASKNLNAFKFFFPVFLSLIVTASEGNVERTVGGNRRSLSNSTVSLEKLAMKRPCLF